MTPRTRRALQDGILDRIKQEHPGTTDSEIAGVAGVDRSLVSRWRNGEREIGLEELIQLQRHFGAEAVLSPIAALDGCDVRRREAEPSPLRKGALAVVHSAGSLAVEIDAALEDGRINQEECDKLSGVAERLTLCLDRLRAAIRPGRSA